MGNKDRPGKPWNREPSTEEHVKYPVWGAHNGAWSHCPVIWKFSQFLHNSLMCQDAHCCIGCYWCKPNNLYSYILVGFCTRIVASLPSLTLIFPWLTTLNSFRRSIVDGFCWFPLLWIGNKRYMGAIPIPASQTLGHCSNLHSCNATGENRTKVS